MKIAVLSDTHSRALPSQLVKQLASVDMIIHAGDICDLDLLKEIEQMNTVKAVCGNMDDATLRRKLPERCILECENVKVGVFHGRGAPERLLDCVQQAFADDHVDVIVFGHSHEPFNKKIGDILFFNPGSPNDDLFAPYCSYGILEIEDQTVKGEIIKVK